MSAFTAGLLVGIALTVACMLIVASRPRWRRPEVSRDLHRDLHRRIYTRRPR